VVTPIAVFNLSGCGGSSSPVGVAVTASAATVDATDAVTLTATVTNDKTPGGVTWSVSGGGTLSNQTTTTATFTAPAASSSALTVTVTATSVADTTKSGTVTLTVPAAPTVTSLTGPQQSVAVGTAYSATLAGTGGISPYKTWAVAAGSLPACLSLNASTGVLSSPSVPTAACVGVYSGIEFSMADSGTPNALTATSLAQTITVTGPTLTFSSTLPAGAVGTAYPGSVTANGALGATTYSLASGALPASGDLVLNAATGAIAGTPKVADAGTFNFSVKVVDQYGDTATSGPLSITITAPTLSFATPTATANVGVAYASNATASGTVGTTTYSLASGALPASGHLVLNAATGLITGTPYAADAGTFNFTVKVVDQYGDTATSGSLGITINAAGAIAFGAAPTGTATAGVAYTSTFSASGGAGALTYSITAGALPTGMNFNASTGAITGTPTGTAQAYNFTAQAADGFGDTPASQAYTITLNPGAATHYVVAVTSATTITAGGTVNFTVTAFDAYSNVATGYAGSVTFTSSDTQATLPANSTLASGTGGFMATLKTAGSKTVTATDTTNIAIVGTSGNITVNPGTATKFLVAAPSTATNAAQFSFTVTAQDSYNNIATGYAGTIHFTSSDGAATLPANSGLTSGTGSFQATLNTNGTQTITATDTGSPATGTSGTITVSNALTIQQTVLPSADDGFSYSFTLTAAGGSGSGYTFATTGASTLGTFGLTLDSSGLIHGTPTGNGTATFTAKVTDSSSNTATQVLNIPVYSGLSLPSPDPGSLPSTGLTNQTYTGSITGVGGTGTYQWSVNGTVVGGGVSLGNGTLTATVSGGNVLNINGAPSSTSTVSFNVKLTDTAANNVFFAQGPYAITISNPIAVSLPTPSGTVPGSGVMNQSYPGSITAINGVGPYTWTINGSPTTGAGYSFGNGTLVAISTGGSTLSFSGTPTSATTIGPFTVNVTDSTQPTHTFASNNYSIVVNPNSGQISGQINMNNNCGAALPQFTVSLTPSNAAPVTTDGSGNFSFSSVPAGTYTITPTIPGATSSAFYPASIPNVVITNGSNFTGQNFSAIVGYTVSGTVSYSGTQTGQTYLYLQNNNCGGSNNQPGTSISQATLTGSGSYSIRGVPPGNYTLNAWMDSTGITSGTDYPGPQGAQNFNDPTGNTSSFSVMSANVTTANVTLNNATFATPPSNPSILIFPHVGGVSISYGPPTVSGPNGNKEEAANEYQVNWAVSDTTDGSGPTCSLGGGTDSHRFLNLAGTHTFYATGKGTDVWILNNTSMGSGTFTSGGTYCFQVRAINTLYGNSSTNHPAGPWATQPDGSGNPQGVTLPTSVVFCSTNCTTVSGTITIPAGVTIGMGVPLYVGIYQQSGSSNGLSAIYSYEIPSPTTGANSYSMTIPNGSNYTLFGVLDQNNDGGIDAYDVTNTGDNNSNGVTYSGGSTTQNLTLPGVNSSVQVQTQYSTSSGGSGYSFNFQVREANKLPVSVTLNSSTPAPYVMTPVDISLSTDSGHDQFQYYTNIPGGTPSVGDSFDFTVTYSDGTTESGTTVNGAVTAFGSTGTVVGAADAATGLAATAGTTPNFSWTDSANAMGSGFNYSFYINQQSGSCSGNCTIWQIPGNNSNSNGFSSSTTSLTWGTDPTGGGSLPNGSLNSADDYSWTISVQDSNGNQAQSSVSDNNP
jgi:hypothetical protein